MKITSSSIIYICMELVGLDADSQKFTAAAGKIKGVRT